MNLTIICNVDVKSKSKGLECNNAFHDAFHKKNNARVQLHLWSIWLFV